MTTYQATFIGRTKGAIGVSYLIRGVRVSGETPEDARLRLYDRFESIHSLILVVETPENVLNSGQ